jgi:hypothetical protein
MPNWKIPENIAEKEIMDNLFTQKTGYVPKFS